ncbi:MAG: hypothetical protein ABR613_08255 [Actinomycetota bacterium]
MGTRGSSQSRLVGKTDVRRPTATVLLGDEVAASEIHAALDRIFEMNGCPACGLIGIDLRLLVRDAKLSGELDSFDGVLGMTIQS